MTRITAQLNHKLTPLDRDDRYGRPLNVVLNKHGYGMSEDGGTMMLESGEIEYIDVEIDLVDIDKSLQFVIERLEFLGAPKGSKILVRESGQKREIPFGKVEGIGLYLDGINLSPEIYKTCDVNLVIEELNARLAGHGTYQSFWQGPGETALYIYGNDAELMKKLIGDYLATYPLCKGARVVTIAPISE